LTSDSDNICFLVKQTSQGHDGKWHLVREKQAGTGICGYNISIINERVGYRRFNVENDSLDEKAGLGSVCKSCREYVTGSLSDHDLPKPSDGRKTKSSIVDSWKGEEKKSAGEVYGQ